MKRLSNKQKFEMLVGRLVILIIEGIIGCGLVLGFFWLLGTLLNWVEQSSLRTALYFVVLGIIIAREIKKEIE